MMATVPFGRGQKWSQNVKSDGMPEDNGNATLTKSGHRMHSRSCLLCGIFLFSMESSMPRWPRLAQRWILLSFALMSLMLVSACTDDLYASCTIDNDDPYLKQCATATEQTKASCVVADQRQCETRICGKFQGSSPFCTIECSTDDDCPNGLCREFVFQSNVKHCVEKSNVGK